MDFIHTAEGEPVLVEHADNFHDLHQRFLQTVTRPRDMIGFDDTTPLTFIVHRRLFTMELFTDARQPGHHIITCEKGYKRGQWNDRQVASGLVRLPTRNSSTDLQQCAFRHIDRPGAKNTSIPQIIVRATKPKGKTIQVSIFATDPERDADRYNWDHRSW